VRTENAERLGQRGFGIGDVAQGGIEDDDVEGFVV
jgi:hypothetical protein